MRLKSVLALLDMDGVIVDFQEALCKAHGIVSTGEFLTPKSTGLPVKEFWAPCNRESFWAEMNWMHDGKEILRLVERNFEETFLLSSPTLGAGSYSGKIKWLERNAPQYKRRTILCPTEPKGELKYTMGKELLATPDRCLIDDSPKFCDRFAKAGGRTILVPRIWNGVSGNPLEVIRNF
jgi:hypothetical protein